MTFPDCAGGGMRLDMADADMPADDAEALGDGQGFARKADLRLAGRGGEDLDVSPGDSARPARPQNLKDGLFGGESAGEMLEMAAFTARAVVLLGRGEAAVEKALAVLGDHALDARGFDDVDAVTHDGHGGKVRGREGGCKVRGG